MGSFEAPREQVLAIVAEELRAQLTGTRFWGGPYPRPVTVSRLMRHPYQVTEVPHLIVLQDDGSQLGPQGHDALPPDEADHFRFCIYAYVDGDDVETPSLWLDRVNLDMKRVFRRLSWPAGPLFPLVAILRFLDEQVDFHETRAAVMLPCLARLRTGLGPDVELP